MTLKERLEFIQNASEEGYLIGQWQIKTDKCFRVYLASWKDKNIGVYLDELINLVG
jgi:hypothetical protein